MEYKPSANTKLKEQHQVFNLSTYEVADILLRRLRLTNGLEFMSLAQRMALIQELSKPVKPC
jgi:hypothetical protein